MRRLLAPCLLVLALGGCSRGGDAGEDRRKAFSRDGEAGPARAAFDPARPETALALGADEVAARLGSFEWTAAVDWTVSRGGEEAARVHAAERHRLRQLATGEFEVEADLDPGLGPGSETGKHVVFAGGMTYGRARGAPFRERPTDRGRDARRFREESFGMARGVAALCGGALAFEPAGEATILGRRALRYRLALAREAPPPAAPARPQAPPPDEDTTRRLAFLDGRLPRALHGELVADAETGAPLGVRLAATFGVKDAPGVTAELELLAQVKALGGKVAPVTAPPGARPDERKPPGVAGALEAAGLKKREGEGERAEPVDEDEE